MDQIGSDFYIKLYQPLYHGTSAYLEPGRDLLYPHIAGVHKINAVFATSSFVKAVACALLSKHNMQNITVGPKGSYSYLYDKKSHAMILFPDWNWDDGAPVFVYGLDRTKFIKFVKPGGSLNGNEYISFSQTEITDMEMINPEHFEKNRVGLYVADSVKVLENLHRIYDGCGNIGRHIIEKTCRKII
ncbi:MAG: hypothetical protein FWC61_00470 [Proteobacteria bacterium]|nr:hypothetical protein [Pseudomonadota bacterium]